MKYIEKIILENLEIPLFGKNLIITGGNGSGKTHFLNKLNNLVKSKFNRDDSLINDEKLKIKYDLIRIIEAGLNDYPDLFEIEKFYINSFYELKNNIALYDDQKFLETTQYFYQELKSKLSLFQSNYQLYKSTIQTRDRYSDFNYRSTFKNDFGNHTKYFSKYTHIKYYEENLQQKIKSINFKNKEIDIKINDINNLNRNLVNNLAISEFFSAIRSSKSLEFKNAISNKNEIIDFEKLLISQRELFLYLKKTEPDNEKIDEIQLWISKLEKDLKEIFENNTTQFDFDDESKKVLITQNNGEKYFSFSSLSSGFQAIFYIYSSLLIHVKLRNIYSNELCGVVIIDEIDAHLHMSLQKKILPFLTSSFPNIQFIVSTHSPFVITSTDDDTVVYDISSGEFFENDLSSYSYESVIKGLFHVEIQSEQLSSEIRSIAKILNDEPNSYESLRNIIKNITPYSKQLDVESKSFYFRALNHLLDNQELGDLDV